MRGKPKRSCRASTGVFAVLMLVIITFVSGFIYYNFVIENINYATNTFNTQMAALLFKSFSMNATHIVAFLQNTGNAMVEISTAYVNGLITAVNTLVNLTPNTIGSIILTGDFSPGSIYNVKLATIFSSDVAFQVSF